ncbi:glycosyltransferase family 2 protein [Flavobacterium sp. ANB]|uniref:glycosyltransferase family 2 protein n=1 Tax=unclassified Flavobacterium TaxID=196869 RepID=UPI0012B6B484|nr:MULTISPECIES: glycosyltransferase family 2 protein [unclassified Flavobacterium]MBF4518054.1 glycosyltransferase family 2 protein [Flavobacterium sp. ANB]MTD71202.1 glycosyltransferase [Flavobacterium sp. LC2016-13]
MISILILTKNEEQDLPGCLESVSWSDDIHVFDSYSEDQTIAIAEKAGAVVTQRIFDGYASQRNASLQSVNFKYPWIFILDADERIPNELISVLLEKTKNAKENTDGFRIRRRDYLGNTWLKYSQISPFYVRLIRKGKAKYHREINEVLLVEGEVEEINGYFDHYPFSKGYVHWLDKHNTYSTMEAKRWCDEQINGEKFSLKKAIFNKDFSDMRYHQKGIFYKLPGRPLIKWFYMIIIRRAFLDGSAGFTYATLQSIYEYFIVLKSKELLNKKKN